MQLNARDCLGFNYMTDNDARVPYISGGRMTGKRGAYNNSVKRMVGGYFDRGCRVWARMMSKNTSEWGDRTELFSDTFEGFIDNYGGWVTLGFNYEPKQVGFPCLRFVRFIPDGTVSWAWDNDTSEDRKLETRELVMRAFVAAVPQTRF